MPRPRAFTPIEPPAVRRRGFTLIELLVVVAIIVALLAILLPSMGKAIDAAQIAVCSSNQRQINLAWRSYAADNRLALVSPTTGSSNPSYGTDHDWVGKNASIPESLDDLEAGQLWRYLQTPDVYRCPGEPRDASYLRSYSLNDLVGGFGYYQPAVKSIRQIKRESDTLVSLEELDLRGANGGSWVIWKTGDSRWVDWPGRWHNAGLTLGFADGHAEYYKFVDPRSSTITTYHENQPDNDDRAYLQRIVDPLRG